MNALQTGATRIDIHSPCDVQSWADLFDVPTAELCDAVVQVGDDAEAVELVLKGSVTVCARH